MGQFLSRLILVNNVKALTGATSESFEHISLADALFYGLDVIMKLAVVLSVLYYLWSFCASVHKYTVRGISCELVVQVQTSLVLAVTLV